MCIQSRPRRWAGFVLLAKVLLAALCLWAGAAPAGITLGGTRVILGEKDREASIPVKNTSGSPYVVQSWIDAGEGQRKTPLVVTPPLSRLDPGRENILRVLRVGGDLPADRESVFWLNVKEIPERPKEENVLQIAVRSRIKLFYRPAGLAGQPAQARNSLQWAIAPGGGGRAPVLRIVNPSPFTVTFTGLKINGGAQLINADMVPARGEATHALSPASLVAQPVEVEFTTLNDYGGETPVERVRVPLGDTPVALVPEAVPVPVPVPVPVAAPAPTATAMSPALTPPTPPTPAPMPATDAASLAAPGARP